MPTKVHLVRAVVFPVVMYECESWTLLKILSHKLLINQEKKKYNLYNGEDAQRAQTLYTQDPGTSQRLRQNCV